MSIPFDLPDFDAHEGVHFFHDRATGLKAIIAIHSTHLGPAAGGARYWHYADSESAVTDALRLSRGMSYKNAKAGLPVGGGKAVLLKEEGASKSPELLAAFGRIVESLGGRYVTAQDVGMSEADMIAIARETRHVSGLPAERGGAGGNPGPSTAYGVFLGIKAAVKHGLGRDDVRGLHVAMQGCGSVGSGTARHLAAAGARLTLADVSTERAQALADELGAAVVDADAILATSCDVLSPCALGAILNERSIAALQTGIVAGGANNQLARPEDGDRLKARGILYAPDYVINAGGIINVVLEYLGIGDADAVRARIEQIPGRLAEIFAASEASGLSTDKVADQMAQRLIGRG